MFEGMFFEKVVNDFLSIGYHVNYSLLNSFDYGVPQKRERIIIYGTKIKQKLLDIYENKGMIKKNHGRKVGATSKVSFLKYEEILWNSLELKLQSAGKSNVSFNWEKITEVCSHPALD